MNSINHLLHQAWKILSSPEHKQIETRGDRFGGGRIKPMSGRSVNTSLPCTPPTAQSFAPRNKFLFTRGSGISAVLIQRVCWTGSSSEMSLQQHFLSWAARKLLKVIPSSLITTFWGQMFHSTACKAKQQLCLSSTRALNINNNTVLKVSWHYF